MRIENWNPQRFDAEIEGVATDRLVKAAGAVARHARRLCPVGTVSRPIYRRGPYAGQNWTARDAGQLRESIRVVEKTSKSGKVIAGKGNVRVYAGHYLAYYASIVEFSGKAFMRPALTAAHSEMMDIIKGG